MDEIKGLLDEEIKDRLETVSDLPQGSPESGKAVDEFEKLYKLRLEEKRVEAEAEEKRRQYELECKAKEDDLVLKKKQHKTQIWTTVATVAVGVLTTAAYIIADNVWFNRGLKFEETGTFCSQTNKNHNSRMFSRRR